MSRPPKGMRLPVQPPVEPMLAKLVREVPRGDAARGLLFEPKWDGFRALVFRDGDQLFTQSRDRKGLDRYFPELAAPLREALPDRCVVDGEVVVFREGRLDFEALQLRIHPAASRVDKLSREIPTSFVAFDLLALGDDDLRGQPMRERRRRLEGALGEPAPPVFLTPMTEDPAVAKDWFDGLEAAGLDGIVAKPGELTYQPKKRVMLKVKHERTADCVVAGFRWHKGGEGTRVGSLLLGLYDDDGVLHHVGVTASFKTKDRERLVDELAPLRDHALEGHPWAAWAAAVDEQGRMPGAQSRWSAGKNLTWEPLRPERVCEVRYDFMQGDRFRHATTFLRWRPDKAPGDCRYDQLEGPAAGLDLRALW